MTDEAVQISITISLSERNKKSEKSEVVKSETIKFEKEARIDDFEEACQGMMLDAGKEMFAKVIKLEDERIAREVPEGWKNVGTEERWLVCSMGTLRYKRRVYLDENKRRRKPLDELLRIERYGRMSQRVQEMGASLTSMGTYRLAASQLSWLIKTPISHSAIQRMAWATGNRIADGEEAERQRVFENGGEIEPGRVAAPVLYGESDGVWVHLQREKRRSVEVRVGILSTGHKQIGKDRYRLENKRCITTIGHNSEQWQEQILREAHLYYDLSQTQLLISGGDGNQWVRHSFDRLEIPQEFILDRFHLHRAARRAFKDRTAAKEMVTRLCQEGFAAVRHDLIKRIEQAEGKNRELLEDFFKYVRNNQDGLLDLKYRGYSHPVVLGGIEGNVDKLVVHRMKGRGCSWRLRGIRAMLALCRNCEQLKLHAYQYLPTQRPEKKHRCSPNLEVEYSEVINKTMPIFSGPDQNKPWVKLFHRSIHGR